MAIIKKSEVVKHYQDTAGLNALSDFTSLSIGQNIAPTLDLNQKYTTHAIEAYSASTGSITVYTTPTDRDYYLTSVSLGFIKSAACDVTNGALSLLVYVNSRQSAIIRIPVLTLTAQNGYIALSFPHPIKVDRGTSITILGTFTVGDYLRTATITGFYY